MPTERMLRTTWSGDSSNAKYRLRSPRSQAAATNAAPNVDLPVPASPEINTLEPR